MRWKYEPKRDPSKLSCGRLFTVAYFANSNGARELMWDRHPNSSSNVSLAQPTSVVAARSSIVMYICHPSARIPGTCYELEKKLGERELADDGVVEVELQAVVSKLPAKILARARMVKTHTSTV